MKKNQLVILAVFFIAAVAAWYYVRQPQKTRMADLYSQVAGRFQTKNIKTIEARVLSHPEKVLMLKLDKDGWKVTLEREGEKFQAPAKKSKVERLIGLLNGLQGELRAKGKKHLSTFGLQEGQGLEISLKQDGKTVVSIVAGMKGPDWGSCFVRSTGSDKVYLVSRDIFSVFDIWSRKPEKALSLEPWVDLDVISAFADAVDTCSYESSNTSWKLSRIESDTGKDGKDDNATAAEKTGGKKKAWRLETGTKVMEKSWEEARQYLSSIIPLRARDIEPPSAAEKAGFSRAGKAQAVFTCRLESGAEKRVEIGSCSSKDKTCLVRAGGYIYKIDSTWKERLEKPFVKGKKGSDKPGKAGKSPGKKAR